MQLAITIVLCCFSLPLLAQTSDKTLSPLGAQSLFETGAGLLLILALIIGGAWLFKRFGQLPMASKGMVSVLGGVSVGPRERVIVVKVEDTRLLLGVAPGHVRKLHVLENEVSDSSFQTQLADARKQSSGDSLS